MPSFLKATSGPFTLASYRRTLEKIQETGAVMTLSVSSGVDERVFFFTRGAILFLATGSSGGHLLERKIIARGLIPKEKLTELRSTPGRERPILQEALREERLIDDATVQGLVNEVIEEQLLEVALWDNEVGIFDVIPGNPPARLYDKNAPAVRLSIGLRAMLASVIPKVGEIPDKILRPLGGSLRSRLKPLGSPKDSTGDATADAVLQHVPAGGRTALQVLASAQRAGIPAYRSAMTLVSLVSQRRISVEASSSSKEEQAEAADTIEKGLDVFVNRLIARQHLAGLYEKLDDKERAGDQLRAISGEYVERDRLDDAVGSLQKALELGPKDLAAREGLVKVLTLAKRPSDGAHEAMNLGHMLLEFGLAGRAKNAFGMAAKLMPGSLEVLWKLASLSETLNDRDEAIRRYEEIAEISRKANDKSGIVSAKQRILALDPTNKRAIKEVRKLSGYQSALYMRLGVVAVAVVAAAVIAGTSYYELTSSQIWKVKRDEAWKLFDAGDVEKARATAEGFARTFVGSRAARQASALAGNLDLQDRLRAALDGLHEAKVARALEDSGQIPDALTHWKTAAEIDRDADRKGAAATSVARLEAVVSGAEKARALAQKAALDRNYQKAHETLADALEQFPWLARNANVKLWCLIDSIPPGLNLNVDGRELASNTPATVERAVVPGRVVVVGTKGERASVELPAIPPWPFVVSLPHPTGWTAPSVLASAPPLLEDSRIVVAGRDRAVTSLARETGALVWRRPLGVFCDMSVTPVLVAGTLVVRTTEGTVVALDDAKGTERWRVPVARPPEDTPTSARPVATAGGLVVLREGPRGLVALKASDGSVAWRNSKIAEDLVGGLACAGDLVLVARGQKVAAHDSRKGGAQVWESSFSSPVVAGPLMGPRGAVFVPLKTSVGRIDVAGASLSDPKSVRDPITSIEVDESHVVVGTSTGEVIVLDSHGEISYRKVTKRSLPVTWLRVGSGLVLASDGGTLVVFDSRLNEQWRDQTNTSPAAVDAGRIYQVGPRGLAAINR